MNFFGHAAVASWRIGRGGLPLGAMLPDFASISGARSLSAKEAEVARGVALHHRTDEVFHAAPSFVDKISPIDIMRATRRGAAR